MLQRMLQICSKLTLKAKERRRNNVSCPSATDIKTLKLIGNVTAFTLTVSFPLNSQQGYFNQVKSLLEFEIRSVLKNVIRIHGQDKSNFRVCSFTTISLAASRSKELRNIT